MSFQAYRRDRRPAGRMDITHAQPLETGPDGLPLQPVSRLSADEAEAEAKQFLQEPATFSLERVRGREPYTHYLRVLSAPPHVCRDYLVQVEQEQSQVGRA